MSQAKYTTVLAKGQGAIEETLSLLRSWEPEMTRSQLAAKVVSEGILGKATAKRAKDMVFEVFGPRYLTDDARPATYLKILLDANIEPTSMGQLLLIYTARANSILRDFICEVYWEKYAAGFTSLTKADAVTFIETSYNLGRLPSRWSEKMVSRVASYLCGCLADFKLLESGRKSERAILAFHIQTLSSLYLTHELHFSGYSDNAILEHPDWQLFGFEPMDVLKELQRVSSAYFITQFSGELLRISWMYNSMEEVLNVIARSGF